MDLHVIAPLASLAEREAVDAVLTPAIGPARSGWQGGARDMTADGHSSRGGHDARAHRDLLLPALHAIQDRIGYISQPALSYVCRRLTIPPAEAYGVATFYALFATTPRPPVVAHVCDDIACRLAGAEDLCDSLERRFGSPGEPALDGRATWLRSPCLGQCELAPAALVTIAGVESSRMAVAPVDAAGIAGRLERAAGAVDGPGGRDPVGRTASNGHGPDGPVASASDRHGAASAASVPPSPADRLAAVQASVPQAGSPGLRLLARIGVVDPTSLDDYRAKGGYRALPRAIALGPGRVIEEITAAKLVGRGGAAFPTGRKWAAVAAQASRPHYLVCNADESEPGTFKDRVLLEDDPFSLVESMTIAGFATGAERGFLYVRGEYPLAEARLANAIARAREAGLLGADILNSGVAFDIELRRGAGAYICGEETALFESIEGKRGEPRNKPPFPVEVGLFGKPTTVNNVETLANVPAIVLEGGAAFAAIGTEGSAGPKLFCLSGDVARPGVYEVEFGVSLRELLELAGGVPDGHAIQAILLGGAAGVFVGPEALDTPLTFEGTRAAGTTLGSGVVMVFDERADLVGALRRIAAFFRDESCGQCVPCRVGSVRQEEILARLATGRPRGSAAAELALLRDVGQAMRDASICGLGQTASSAIESAFRQAEPGGPVTIDPILFSPPARPTRPPKAPPEPVVEPIGLTIDGQAVSVPAGATILEACRAEGIDTPTLCYLENLTPVNVCRVCVVEVTGSRVLVPACSRKVEAGMDVSTDSERVRHSRRLVLEFLGSSVDTSLAGPAAPDGSIAAYAERYGADASRFGPPAAPAAAGERDHREAGHHHASEGESVAATVAQPVKIDNELYVRDYSKCILCYKCVEACGVDAQNTFAIAVAGRGFDARISTEWNVGLPDSACVYCGNCIGVCPTGALMFRSEHEMREAGTWDESAQTATDTICPYCGVGCTLTLHVQDNDIVKVTSPLDSSVTEGHLCVKGRFGFEYVQNREPR